MTRTKALPSIADRLERVGSGKRVTPDELRDLAEYVNEITEWADDLSCQMADFAAEAEMLADPGTLRADRADIRQRMIENAENAAGALRVLSDYCAPAVTVAAA